MSHLAQNNHKSQFLHNLCPKVLGIMSFSVPRLADKTNCNIIYVVRKGNEMMEAFIW